MLESIWIRSIWCIDRGDYKLSNFSNIALKVLRKLNMRDLAYFTISPFSKKIVNTDADIARKNLEEVNPKTKSTAIANNSIIQSELDLTIIVPAYNVEKYIDECMNSLLSQITKYNYKIVIIDDGSTDNTTKILNKYADNELVNIIVQKNSGQSVARNKALEKIYSKYIMFVDSDDKVECNIVETLLNKAYQNQYDLVECGYHRFKDKDIVKSFSHKNEDDIKNRIHLYGMPWGKVIRSEIFKNIKFPEGYWYEDTIMAYLVFPSCKKIATISDCLYFYRYNSVSSSYANLQNPKRIDGYWITEQLLEDRKKLELKPNQEIYEHSLIQIVNNYHRIREMSREINEYQFILSKKMLENNFKGYKTENKKYEPLEKAIKTNDFGNYNIFCFLKE